MPISIYPPTLQSTQPAFLATTPDYEIKYTLQKVTSAETIKHIQIRVVEQRSNSSIVNTSKYPDNIIYKNVDLTKESSPYGIKILAADLRKSWSPGVCYKIQLRFGSTNFPTHGRKNRLTIKLFLSGLQSWLLKLSRNQKFISRMPVL